MALMKFREPNHVLWQGARPGHDGAQIRKNNSADNVIATVHTVNVGMTFYLCYANIGISWAAAAGDGYLLVDNGAIAQYNILACYGLANAMSVTQVFEPWIPLEIPAGWRVRVASGAVNIRVRSFVFGWEE